MEKRAYRSYEFEIRAEGAGEQGNILTGRPIVFGAKTGIGGWYDEIIEPGALDATDLRDVPFLVNHNDDMIPAARSRNNNANSTMQLSVVPEGMDIRVALDTERNADSAALYSACERGDISGMSFAFTVDEDMWEGLDTEMPTRHIRKISKVWEVSAVTWPAYQQTSIEARAKAETLESGKALLESKRAEAENAKNAVARRKLEIILEVNK